MDFKVVWTDPALQQLRDACTYISQANPAAAQRFGEQLLNHVDVLAKSPLIGSLYSRSPSGRIREILCGSYRVFYRVSEERKRIEVLAIWHSARASPDFN